MIMPSGTPTPTPILVVLLEEAVLVPEGPDVIELDMVVVAVIVLVLREVEVELEVHGIGGGGAKRAPLGARSQSRYYPEMFHSPVLRLNPIALSANAWLLQKQV